MAKKNTCCDEDTYCVSYCGDTEEYYTRESAELAVAEILEDGGCVEDITVTKGKKVTVSIEVTLE